MDHDGQGCDRDRRAAWGFETATGSGPDGSGRGEGFVRGMRRGAHGLGGRHLFPGHGMHLPPCVEGARLSWVGCRQPTIASVIPASGTDRPRNRMHQGDPSTDVAAH